MLRTFKVILAAGVLATSAVSAFGQATVQQGGAMTSGHAPMYVQGGGVGATPVIQDSGPASGATKTGMGLSELMLTARGTGSPPYISQGSGPSGTIFCQYDAPITNVTGYHYVCMGPNPSRIVAGAGGPAAQIPFTFLINGATYQFPAGGGTFATVPVPNSQLASMAKATIKGAPTAAGQPTDFTIQGLTARGAPDANNDKLLIFDNASGTFKYVTPGLIASSATAGVSSLGAVTGAITLGSGLQMSGSQLQNTGVLAPGGSSGQIQYNNAGALGGFVMSGDVAVNTSSGVATIQPNAVTAAKIAPGAANTFKGTLNGSATSDIALTACTLSYQITKWVAGTGWQCGLNPVIPSRAIAATLDLSAFSVITTQGYATAGDGGSATFRNATTSPFLDANISLGTISGNGTSGCTTQSNKGVVFSGGTGTGFMATVVASGGIVTTVTPAFTPGGWGYTVGDVLSATIPGCSTTVTYTVSTLTTTSASFTDSAGNHLQYVVDDGNFINPRQFGAVFNWNGTDGSATDSTASLQAAFNYGARWRSSIFTVNGTLTGGTKVILPTGIAMFCSTLTLYGGTQVEGQGLLNSGLHACDAFSGASTNLIELCDPNAQIACITPRLAHMVISATTAASANSGTYVIHTNAAQQGEAINNVSVYGGKRGCFRYDTGYGGASSFVSHVLWCTMFGVAVSDGIVLNAGSTLLKFYDTIVESSSYSGNAMNLLGGQITVDGFHTEGITGGINVNLTTSTWSFTLLHATGGPGGCTQLVNLQSTNTFGNMAIYDAVKNGCTRLVTNGQSGGSNRSADAVPSNGWVSFNP